MQTQLNNILKQKGFLQLTRENEQSIEKQPPITTTKNTSIQLLDTGVLLVEPSDYNGTDLVISSGVHGNETAPIEIVDKLVEKIINEKLTVSSRVLFIIGNPVAMNQSQRFDVENMNRLFNGKHQDKDHHEAKRAERLEHYVSEFYNTRASSGSVSGTDSVTRLHYDLHTAIRPSKYKKFAIYPFPDGKPWDKSQLEFFLSSDINTILLGHQPAGTFSYFTSHQFNAHGFTVELGKVKPFGENDPQDFTHITRNLERLIEGKPVDTKTFDNQDFNLFQVKHELLKQSESFKLNISQDVENFTSFEQGYQLTDDADGGYQVEATGEAIVFPNENVPVGQRAGLVVVKTRL
ncbi:succinylglutamate desuccinylase [Pleionea mediterranea]|uniref:Succinylglutamate desuccinylase n=1 Tax=Pleionea mediterranea TaxID=523701 RepID=A0A316F8V8_9GAMM|nr:succinylglutamate desuccinylase [Pleionea mediterranea]PWK41914.1 succinylglutamate desuccinylase [Pleionea mediterranea]